MYVQRVVVTDYIRNMCIAAIPQQAPGNVEDESSDKELHLLADHGRSYGKFGDSLLRLHVHS